MVESPAQQLNSGLRTPHALGVVRNDAAAGGGASARLTKEVSLGQYATVFVRLIINPPLSLKRPGGLIPE